MIKSSRTPLLLTAIAASIPSRALAHPGHDDGHELTWDFSHLAAHPLATFMCIATLAAGAWIVWRLVARGTTKPARTVDRT